MPSSAWSSDVCSRSEEHTSELQSLTNLVCRLLPEKNRTLASATASTNAAARPAVSAAGPAARPPRPTPAARRAAPAAGPAATSAARFFFFNDTATTEIYTLSLHDALPIWKLSCMHGPHRFPPGRHLRKLILRSEEHTSELQSLTNLVCRLLLEKKRDD